MPKIPPTIYGIVLGIWLLFFVLGKRQFEKVKAYTLQLVVDEFRKIKRSNPVPNLDNLFQAIMDIWEPWLAKNIRFIPHKTEFWPMPAKPDYVRQRMNLNPEWMGAYLELKGMKVEATPEQAEKIAQIVAMAPQNQTYEDNFPEYGRPPKKEQKEKADE